MRGAVTLRELESCYDLVDVLDMNEALDWHDACEAAAYENLKRDK